MPWPGKNTLQRSFADSLLYEHAALTELDNIQNLIDWSEIEYQLRYADSTYKSREHDALLEHKGIKNRVLHRAYRNTPLSEAQKAFNRLASQVRCTVERTFGALKRIYGMGQTRYMGLARNQARVTLMAMVHNLKRGVNIQRACA